MWRGFFCRRTRGWGHRLFVGWRFRRVVVKVHPQLERVSLELLWQGIRGIACDEAAPCGSIQSLESRLVGDSHSAHLTVAEDGKFNTGDTNCELGRPCFRRNVVVPIRPNSLNEFCKVGPEIDTLRVA